MKNLGVLVLLVLLAGILTGCASTLHSRSVEPSGFLGDYSMLTEGDGDQALLRYVKPGVKWGDYDKIIIEPVTLWMLTASTFAELPTEDLQDVANYLHAEMTERLGRDWKLAAVPGPSTLVLQVALTEADKSKVSLDVISTIMPIGLALSGIKTLATGTPNFVGKASAEMELTDSVTGERLAAAVDRRVGGKSLSGATGSWSDVKSACDKWVDDLATRLAEMR